MTDMIRSTLAEYAMPIWLNPEAYLGDFVMVIDGQLVEDEDGIMLLKPHEVARLSAADRQLMRPLLIGYMGADYA